MSQDPHLSLSLAKVAGVIEARREALRREMEQLDRDASQVASMVALCERYDTFVGPASSKDQRPPRPAQWPLSAAPGAPQPPGADVVSFRSPKPQSALGDFEMHRAVIQKLGPERDDSAIPPTIDARGDRADTRRLPVGPSAVETLRRNVRDIASAAAKAPPGPGGRRSYPMGQLVPGQPWQPTIRNALRAADRPLTSAGVAVAFLEARQVVLAGPELKAAVNRISSLISREAACGRIARIAATLDQRQTWIWVRRPSGAGLPVSGQTLPNLQPSGSTG